MGRTAESIAAYRKSIELLPSLGESYWSLANLKTFRFDDTDVAAMRAQLERAELAEEDRLHFHFALGKALEDTGVHAESFEQYEKGNALRLAHAPYDREEFSDQVRRCRTLFTRAFFTERKGSGCDCSIDDG